MDLIDRDATLDRIDCCLGNSFGGRKEFDNGLIQARKFVISTPSVNRWIQCSDMLPEDEQRVLICSKSKRLFDVFFRANAQMPSFDTKIFGKVFVWYLEDVIKWMPLPEPQKE